MKGKLTYVGRNKLLDQAMALQLGTTTVRTTF